MAMYSNAAMVLYYDFDGDAAEHDDWHTYEHMHERLSIPGFQRGTRWIARSGAARYLIVYEVSGVDIAGSPAYLARLDDPTPWTRAIMARLRGMVRGFCNVVATSGFGQGRAALSIRFVPRPGAEVQAREILGREALPAIVLRRGVAGAHLLVPEGRAPMTREQAIRGRDKELDWVLMLTAHEPAALQRAFAEHFSPAALERYGISLVGEPETYDLQYTVTATEVAQCAPHPPLDPASRAPDGVRRSAGD